MCRYKQFKIRTNQIGSHLFKNIHTDMTIFPNISIVLCMELYVYYLACHLMMSVYAVYCRNKWCVVENEKEKSFLMYVCVMLSCMTSDKIWTLLAVTYI
jgi:hypothetical protein